MDNQLTMIVKSNGTKEWRLNGILHRTEGPAVEFASGCCVWYYHGVIIPWKFFVEHGIDPFDTSEDDRIMMRLSF